MSTTAVLTPRIAARPRGTVETSPVCVAIDRSLASQAAEVKYVFRTLLRLAGYAYEFTWAGEEARGDIYYGPRAAQSAATIAITASCRSFADAESVEPIGLTEEKGLTFARFANDAGGAAQSPRGWLLTDDIVFTCYWLLTGARESRYPRDRRDNLDLGGSGLLRTGLLTQPLVSLYATWLRDLFTARGRAARPLPWSPAAFAFSHDVDYPQIIKSAECLRLLKSRGLAGWKSIRGIINGASHFWKFAEWVEFEKSLGARPAFYFMARRGSPFRYAADKPDAFYDIYDPVFTRLFRELRDAGCEIGLHASYNAYRSADRLRREREDLERASGVRVFGNRHHYWHLDPADPNESLRRLEESGLEYDSSLAFEFYPGFRRGVCHPFRPFHPGERRELDLIELPPAWMDDHFDRRRAVNGIADPEGHALTLVDAARATGGAVVVDYHARGMNGDFYPMYGPWLAGFAKRHLADAVDFRTPAEIARQYREYEAALEARSRDRAATPSGVTAPSVTVTEFQVADRADWDAFVASHPQATVYHSLAWKAVTEEGLGHRAQYLIARAGGEVTGVLPLFRVKGLFGRRLVSVPMRDRAGLLARDAATAAALLEAVLGLSRRLSCKYVELRSADSPFPAVTRRFGGRTENHWVTTRVDLTPGVDALWKALDRDTVRWSVKKARKNGLVVEADDTRRGMEIFFNLFVRTRQGLGIPPFPMSLFQAIWRNVIRANKGNLWLIRQNGRPVHGMISFFSGDTFIPAYAAPQEEHRKLYPSELMIWHSLEWAATNGFRRYDFGADSPNQTGLLWFKRKWGGVQHPMCYTFFLPGGHEPPNFDSSSPTFNLARKVWCRLPVPVCRSLGDWVTRQLS